MNHHACGAMSHEARAMCLCAITHYAMSSASVLRPACAHLCCGQELCTGCISMSHAVCLCAQTANMSHYVHVCANMSHCVPVCANMSHAAYACLCVQTANMSHCVHASTVIRYDHASTVIRCDHVYANLSHCVPVCACVHVLQARDGASAS